MRQNNFDKKIRFSYFLPYGFISPAALELAVNDPADAYKDYDQHRNMAERVQSCKRAHLRRIDALRYMEKYGYVEDLQIKYGGAAGNEVRMYRLTQSGFYLLSNTPDAVVEEKRLQTSYKPPKRNLKEISYLPSDRFSIALRDALFQKALLKNDSQEDAAEFDAFFLESFPDSDLTILASEPVLAKSISTVPALKSNQIYTAWKLMNIEALFRANGFLTSIDRRHIDLGWNIKTPTEIAEARGKADVRSYTEWTIAQWYRRHPNSYVFRSPMPGTVQRDTWAATPAFYPLRDIPGFESIIGEAAEDAGVEGMNPGGAAKLIRHSSLGLAVGLRSNYLVFHTTQKGTLWSVGIERNAANAAQRALNLACSEAPVLGANRTVQNAIIVCPTVHQFAALFNIEEPLPNRWRKYVRIDAPFNSACIVPINHSGMMQLRMLIYSNPITFEQTLIASFKKLPGFTDRPAGSNEKDNIFKLSYNGKPVLLAQLMEYQKLYWAKQQYDEGKRFYVVCYPEQVKFIQKIMPEVNFL